MSRRGKLLADIFAAPPGGGSHYSFTIAGGTESIPRQNPLGRPYVKKVRDLLARAGGRP